MRSEDIVARGVELTRERRRIDAELFQLRQQIETVFPCRLTQEEIAFECGRVTRSVERNWWIKPDHLGTVRQLLGTAYAYMIDDKQPLVVTAALRSLLKNDASDVGRAIRPYVIVDVNVRIVFQDAVGHTAVDEGGSVVRDARELVGGA